MSIPSLAPQAFASPFLEHTRRTLGDWSGRVISAVRALPQQIQANPYMTWTVFAAVNMVAFYAIRAFATWLETRLAPHPELNERVNQNGNVLSSFLCRMLVGTSTYAVNAALARATHYSVHFLALTGVAVAMMGVYHFSRQPANQVNIEVIIPQEVKPTLDKLFENSPYSIDTLPVYPILINEPNHPMVKREEMTAPVMKGMCDDGRAFIAIKIECSLSDENLANKPEWMQEHYNNRRQQKEILLLFPYRRSNPFLIWDQLGRGANMTPFFFNDEFTCADGTGPRDSQKEHFALVQTLLKTGTSQDISGLVWHISGC